MSRTKTAWSLLLGLCMAVVLMLAVAAPTTALAASTEVDTETELIDALGQAQDGDTIQLTADIETDEQLTISAAVTLDLGGYTLTNTWANNGGTGADRFTLIASADGVTTQNGTYKVTAEKGTSVTTQTSGITGSVGDLTLSGVTVTGGITTVGSTAEDGTLTIKDSTISGDYAVGSDGDGNKVVISNSTLTGDFTGFVSASEGGTLSIDNSTLSGSYGIFYYNVGGVATINDSTLTGEYGGLYHSYEAYLDATSSSATNFTCTAENVYGNRYEWIQLCWDVHCGNR